MLIEIKVNSCVASRAGWINSDLFRCLFRAGFILAIRFLRTGFGPGKFIATGSQKNEWKLVQKLELTIKAQAEAWCLVLVILNIAGPREKKKARKGTSERDIWFSS